MGKTICAAAKIPGKKSNHSARRTAITTLVFAGVEPNVVQQLSGHIQSINNYNSPSMEQQKTMNSIIAQFTSENDNPMNEEGINNETTIKRDSQEMVENILNEITS